MADRIRTVTIFGTSKATPGDGVFEQALQLGSELAQNGFTIANGGYGGTMLASAKGASEARGEVIGVTCTAFGRSGPNKYLTKQIQTKTLEQRLKTLLKLGDAYMVLPGGTGTLLELANVWELKNKRFTDAEKPIIIVGTFWKDLISLVEKADPGCSKYIDFARTPAQAVEMLMRSV
jgi:hypothetical protein